MEGKLSSKYVPDNVAMSQLYSITSEEARNLMYLCQGRIQCKYCTPKYSKSIPVVSIGSKKIRLPLSWPHCFGRHADDIH